MATIGAYQTILDEAVNALSASRLFPLIDCINIHVVGDGPLQTPANIEKIRVVRASPDVAVFERPTLEAMWAYARDVPTARVLYLNCLGGRYQGQDAANRAEWRRMLYFVLIERHADALAELVRADCCGVEWCEWPLPHLTSNNWWARASHLAALPAPKLAEARLMGLDLRRFGRHWSRAEVKRRHACELWIGMRDGVVARSLFPLSRTGLPRSPYGVVPWWELRRVPWESLARRQHELGIEYPALAALGTRIRVHATYGVRQFLRHCRSTVARSAAWVRRQMSP